MLGSGLGAKHTVVCQGLCSLVTFGIVGEMGINQNTLQVDANEETITSVLNEEEELKEDGDRI